MGEFGTPNYYNLSHKSIELHNLITPLDFSHNSDLFMPGEFIINKIIYYKLGNMITSGGGGCLYHGVYTFSPLIGSLSVVDTPENSRTSSNQEAS